MQAVREKLLLVDGHNLLFQMFYGMPSRIVNREGIAVQGVLGFVGALRKMLALTSPTHVGVLFDSEAPRMRQALDPNYKANRPDYEEIPPEELPFEQLPMVYRALTEMGIAHREVTGGETDDAVAAYARSLPQDAEVVIASMDSDFFQLIRENVTVLRYRGKDSLLCDDAYVQGRYGVSASRYADAKALTGDASDNIPGVPGVGPKTAASLMNRFGTLEELLEHSGEIQRPSLRRAVEENAERICLNARLIRLTGEMTLPLTWEEMRYRGEERGTKEILESIGVLP